MTRRPSHLRYAAFVWLTAGLIAVVGWGVPATAGEAAPVELVDPVETDDVREDSRDPLLPDPTPTTLSEAAWPPVGRHVDPGRSACPPGSPPANLVILLCRFLC